MTEEQFLQDKPSTSIISQVVYRYLPFWPVFLLLTAISLAVSFVYLRSQTKIYVAGAKVLIKDPNRNGGDSKVLDQLNIFNEKKVIENEIIVLASSSLMEQVVKDLHLYATVYNEGKVQTEELYGNNSPIQFVAVKPDSVNYGGKYDFDIDWKGERVKINNHNIPFNGIAEISGTSYFLKVNPKYNRNAQGKNYFVVFNSVSGASSALTSSLKINVQAFNSTVLDVSMQSPVPEKAKAAMSDLFDVYNIEGVKDKNQIATNTIQFIEDRLNTVNQELDSVERNMQNYRAREAVADLGQKHPSILETCRTWINRRPPLNFR